MIEQVPAVARFAPHARRVGLLGPACSSVTGHPDGIRPPGLARNGNWRVEVPGRPGGNGVADAGADAGNVQQAQPARLRAGATHRTRRACRAGKARADPGQGKHMAAPGDAAVVRHQDGVRPGDDIAGARCHAGDPVQDRRGAPQRAGLGPPGGAAVPGGDDGARRSHRLAPQRAEAGHRVQPLPRAAGLRPPRTGRHRGAARARRTRPGLARAPTTSQQDRSDTQPGRRCRGRGPRRPPRTTQASSAAATLAGIDTAGAPPTI